MKPIIELSGLLSFGLFKTYLPRAHHSSWNVLEEINAAENTDAHFNITLGWGRFNGVVNTSCSLSNYTSRLFMNLERKHGRRGMMASRCNYKDIQEKYIIPLKNKCLK